MIPLAIVRWAVTRFDSPQKHRAQISTTAMIAGIVAFGGFFGACILLVHACWGFRISLAYALTLPPSSPIAFYYERELCNLVRGLRTLWILFRAPFAAKHLVKMRAALIALIEAARADLARNKS